MCKFFNLWSNESIVNDNGSQAQLLHYKDISETNKKSDMIMGVTYTR